MNIWPHFRGDFRAGRAKLAESVLFGTTGLSGVFAFATPRAIGGYRSNPKVDPRGSQR
jgi:hypothetical protein